MSITLQNEYARYVIGATGRNLHLIDKRSGVDYCARKPASVFALVRKAGRQYRASAVTQRGDELTVEFGRSGVTAVIKATAEKRYLTFEVGSVTGEGAEELAFANVELMLKGSLEEPFACCALALNLKTNVAELPGPSARLRAACVERFGFAGAKVAIIACPTKDMRAVMKEVVTAAPDLPHSAIGGPWALDAEINRGSYLFNFGNLSEQVVDRWIEVVGAIGFNQIDFHGGSSFRFGDFRPNPETYPQGYAGLKAVIDRLHAAGIKAGLHTYSFFIDKSCPYVTPVPDARLAKDATFTLAAPMSAEDTTVAVVEPTDRMSAITGFFVRNSVTLHIDDELIVYTGVSDKPPYVFTGCQRGAYGTKAAAHAAGAKVGHLKECFGLFVPDPETTLFGEVAAKTAEIFNECGFDMMYLDALDGEDVLGGHENSWHYGSAFVFGIWKHLKRPALMEMSTFHHHLWYVRSRMGAWDAPGRGHKRFIDLHCKSNEDNGRMFLPGQLGWWAIKLWSGAQGEPTYTDDIEYLCLKALANDTGLSLMGVDPDSIRAVPAIAPLAAIFQRYENLRHSGVVSQSVKAQLRVPGDEFTLEQNAAGKWQFRRIEYAKHKVQGIDGRSNVWRTTNAFDAQPVQLRIEALYSAGPYDAPGNTVMADFGDIPRFATHDAQTGVRADLASSSEQVKAGSASGRFAATSERADRTAAWAGATKTFPSPLDLSGQQALGVWVYGDGQGEVLNLQLRSPAHISGALAEHYVVVDFTGWRYFQLIEPETDRYLELSWPYGSAYEIFHFTLDTGHVGYLGLWYNNLPPGKSVACYLSPIKAMPLVDGKIVNPSVSIGGKTVTFPVTIETGCYLEFRAMSDCKLYDRQGAVIADVKPQGEAPLLAAGENKVTFGCDAPAAGPNPRAYVTVISRGETLPAG